MKFSKATILVISIAFTVIVTVMLACLAIFTNDTKRGILGMPIGIVSGVILSAILERYCKKDC
jgi:hypothetical protein